MKTAEVAIEHVLAGLLALPACRGTGSGPYDAPGDGMRDPARAEQLAARHHDARVQLLEVELGRDLSMLKGEDRADHPGNGLRTGRGVLSFV